MPSDTDSKRNANPNRNALLFLVIKTHTDRNHMTGSHDVLHRYEAEERDGITNT